ncbi:MAG: TVP38/TMEM64 family protein [Nitrospinae bacterium]|nr:TVP38/TMEM64 family protein [Nitrospinota bacterium]
MDRQRLFKLFIFIAILAAIVTAVKVFGFDRYLEKDRLQSWINNFGSAGPIAYVILFSITPSLFLPGLPVTVAGGIAFGPFWGTVYASIGSTIGACLAFLIARYFARSQIENLLTGRLQAIDEGVKKNGWLFVATTRLIPLFPFNLLNYAFGLTKIRFKTYAITSWICMLPATIAYTVFSSSLLDILHGRVSKELIIGVALIVIVSSIPVIYKMRR